MKEEHVRLFMILNAVIVVSLMNLIEYLFFAPYEFSILFKVLVPAVVAVAATIAFDKSVLKL